MSRTEILQKYRVSIDKIDKKIIDLLASRALLSIKISTIKKKNNLPVADPEREKRALVYRCSYAREKGIGKTFVMLLFRMIFRYSRQLQKYPSTQASHFDKKSKK